MPAVKVKLSNALAYRLIADGLNHVVMLFNVARITGDKTLEQECQMWITRHETWSKQIIREQER